MAESQGRCVFQVANVHFKLPYATYNESTVQLFPDKICVLINGETKLRIPLMHMRSIEIHQPMFGANYITGEYSEQESVTAFTMTFNKGGATDFARNFFSLTEGQLVTSAPREPTQPSDEKKTK